MEEHEEDPREDVKPKKERTEKQKAAWEKAMSVQAEKAKLNKEYKTAIMLEKELKLKEKEDKIKQVQSKVKKIIKPKEDDHEVQEEEDEEEIVYKKKPKAKVPKKKKVIYISESSEEEEEEVVYKKKPSKEPKKTVTRQVEDVASESLHKRLREERILQAISSLGFTR